MPTFRKITRITRLSGPATVHNFHVPGPETFVANGIITHNCYVVRRKGFANPVTTFVNIEQIAGAIERHAAKQGMKLEPTAADPDRWVYELGTNSDAGVDAAISDNLRDLVALFRRLPNARATFSTKLVNRAMLEYDPQRNTRLRFSLMPAHVAKVVDVRTSPVDERIAAINEFHAAGYEVNLNFAPVIYTETWRDDYAALFRQLDDTLSDAVKRQLVAEVIFLTHNAQAHELNLQWHPRAEELLWRPELQETKISGNGAENLRYRRGFKGGLVREFRALLAETMPYCGVRYAF
jgi:spore photoproduct lyase